MNRQLLKELHELVNAGIVSQETAQRIIDYYQQRKQPTANTFIIILGILGALLTGSGILLIVAHNWDDLSVPLKTVVSFFPLLLAQLVCVYTLLQKKTVRTWRESSSICLFFAVGACIALISQVYQVNGTLSGFLLTWILLSLPLIYILSANVVALLCISGITWYATELGYNQTYPAIPWIYVVILLLILPHYYRLLKTSPSGSFYHLMNWFGAISIMIVLGSFVNKVQGLFQWVFLLYCLLFCAYYFIGRNPFFGSKKTGANPFLVIGTAGILITLLSWSFSFIWKDFPIPKSVEVFNNLLFYLLMAGLPGIAVLAWYSHRIQQERITDPLGYTFIVLLFLAVALTGAPYLAVFIVNAWTIFIGVFFIRKGALRNHFGIVNFGLSIIAALAICRFFDEKIPFIWRGIFFLTAGTLFFAANYLLLRKRKHLTKPA